MNYTATKIDGQDLMYRIDTQHNGANINFNVVCAESDSEIESLVQHHLDFLNSGPVVQPTSSVQQTDTNALILSLKAELDEMKAKVAALESGS